jgi:ATP-dependent Clp protease ATP-binding subunit ClpA
MPFTPRAKKALEHALREAIALGHNHIGTEHVLLALLRDEEGVALRILVDFSATPELVREGVARELGIAPAELPRAAVRRPVLRRRRLDVSTAFVVGWLLFAASLGIGILIGWAIWG